jgi:hypothetical protein
MITLTKHGVVIVSLATGMTSLFFLHVGQEVIPEMHLSYSLICSAFITAGTLNFINIFSTADYYKTVQERDLLLEFLRLMKLHGSPEEVLSYHAKSLVESFDRQNALNTLRIRDEGDNAVLSLLNRKIPEDKEGFAQLVTAATHWGVKVPERWQYKDWILPDKQTTTTEAAVPELPEST